MTNALSTLTPGRGIAPVSRAVADLTSRLHNKLEPIPGEWRRCALSAAAEPSAEERQALVERRQHLDERLQPCDNATVLRSVGLLRSLMAAPNVDEETRKLQKAGFLMTLTKYPGWAVEAACAQFLEADEGEGVHAPKPGEIAKVCRRLIAEAQYERAKINAVLDAEIYTPPTDEERAKVAKAFADFSAAFAQQAGGDFNAMKASPGSQAHADRLSALSILKQAEAKAKSEQSEGVRA
ncbi:hypothetical protein SB2_11715 [Methylobacterium radiotolerans]|nr:hypothetical protein SB3_10910 [Methylobacterium radiotolerans]KTS47960.1 hypothetical protein SB2_11715 [Methylobacterium radiotolerans]